MGEDPFRHKPFAVWEGQHFTDLINVKSFMNEQKAQEEIDERMLFKKQLYLMKTGKNISVRDKILIKESTK